MAAQVGVDLLLLFPRTYSVLDTFSNYEPLTLLGMSLLLSQLLHVVLNEETLIFSKDRRKTEK